MKDFRSFCSRLTLEDGRPFELESFQERMLERFFGGASELVIVIPKKNGKSTLLAIVLGEKPGYRGVQR